MDSIFGAASVQIAAVVAAAAFLPIYYYLLDQVKETWKRRPKEGELSTSRFGLDLGRYASWILLGWASVPIDWYISLSRLPMLFLIPLLLMQLRRPNFDSRSFWLLMAKCSIVLFAVGMVIHFFLIDFFIVHRTIIKLVVFAMFIAGLTWGVTDQARQIRKTGGRSVRKGLQLAFLANYLAWFWYGVVSQSVLVVSCYLLAVVGQLWILQLLSTRRIIQKTKG
jgi:hypothetical protein